MTKRVPLRGGRSPQTSYLSKLPTEVIEKIYMIVHKSNLVNVLNEMGKVYTYDCVCEQRWLAQHFFQLNVRPGGIWALGWGKYRCRGSPPHALASRCRQGALPLQGMWFNVDTLLTHSGLTPLPGGVDTG